VRLVPTDREVLVAEDDEGRTLDYDTEGWSSKEPDQRAAEWLGFSGL